VDKVEEELRSGYQRIKLKIKPGKDCEYVAAVRRQFPNILLSVDANSAYRLQDAEHLRNLDEFNLLMMEQPLHWDDIYVHAKLQSLIKSPICLDECIHNTRHALAAIEWKACRIINIKLGRVGGHTEARILQNACRERGVPVWCGGMLESGIGRAHNIAMSTLPGFRLPGDVSASRRYWDEDIIEPVVEVSAKGTIRVPKAPGLATRSGAIGWKSLRFARTNGERATLQIRALGQGRTALVVRAPSYRQAWRRANIRPPLCPRVPRVRAICRE
jgi:O-succinylbenzoate synthase